MGATAGPDHKLAMTCRQPCRSKSNGRTHQEPKALANACPRTHHNASSFGVNEAQLPDQEVGRVQLLCLLEGVLGEADCEVAQSPPPVQGRISQLTSFSAYKQACPAAEQSIQMPWAKAPTVWNTSCLTVRPQCIQARHCSSCRAHLLGVVVSIAFGQVGLILVCQAGWSCSCCKHANLWWCQPELRCLGDRGAPVRLRHRLDVALQGDQRRGGTSPARPRCDHLADDDLLLHALHMHACQHSCAGEA